MMHGVAEADAAVPSGTELHIAHGGGAEDDPDTALLGRSDLLRRWQRQQLIVGAQKKDVAVLGGGFPPLVHGVVDAAIRLTDPVVQALALRSQVLDRAIGGGSVDNDVTQPRIVESHHAANGSWQQGAGVAAHGDYRDARRYRLILGLHIAQVVGLAMRPASLLLARSGHSSLKWTVPIWRYSSPAAHADCRRWRRDIKQRLTNEHRVPLQGLARVRVGKRRVCKVELKVEALHPVDIVAPQALPAV